MGRLMGSSNSNNYGEQIFINKASEYLDDTNIIYWNRQLFGKEFDVCILMPEKGILVVELKGWREENILRIENNDSVIIQTNDGEVSASPQKQARGYRFSIERHIRQNIGKFPLVYQMVCLPQVSKAFFKSHRLDVVMEEKFTILKEDLKDNTSFFNKLDQALREVCHWNRDPFDRRTMLEVRNLFETDINVDEDGESEIEKELASSYHRHDYSRFYYFNEFDQMSGNTINDMVAQYLHGCKLYCVFSKKAQMLAVIKALDTALTQRGLVRNRDNIEIAFDEQKSHTPLAESVGDMFMGFHCSMSVLSAPFDKNTTSFAISNGSYSSAQKRILEKLSEQSQFNFEQYQVEHATPEKNIVIRAGAGTGKTYTMISRIGFICYTQNVPLQKMADRIVMITFTNEAADQMEEKLKAYFKNCYLVTSKPDYLQMISQIDHMQISTIHSYAKNLIAQMGTSFGYGIDLSITSSEFYRRKKISDLLDAYIYQKEMEQGKNYTDKLGMPVYAIRDSILDFIGKLHNKSVDIGAIEPQDFGTLLNNESHGELHELLASVIPAVEREYFEELIEDNKIHLSSMMSVLNRFINVLSIYASEDDNLFATAMMGWGKQAGLNPEKPTKTGLIEFRESSFSVNAARQSLFIPPDWKRYSNTSIMRREGKILGSFDRGTAATREDILFFAPGDAVYDSIISNAVGCNRGRCTGIETTGTYNYDGLVYIYNIAPELDELLENEMPMQTLAQYKMYLPLRQIFVAIPLNIKSKEIPEKEVVKTLLTLRPNNAGHVGRRSAGRLSISPLERFISRTPPSTWEPLVDKYSAAAYARARARLEKRSDLEAAEKEMQCVLNGYRASFLR